MALIDCSECGRKISDKAATCPNCGAPVEPGGSAPTTISLDGDIFVGTKAMLVQLAAKSVQLLNWKVDSADESSGLVSFTTGVTWGSWSGVSGSIYIQEVEAYRFAVTGTAKQNVKGGQVLALDIGGEARRKVAKVIETMKAGIRGGEK